MEWAETSQFDPYTNTGDSRRKISKNERPPTTEEICDGPVVDPMNFYLQGFDSWAMAPKQANN